MGLISRLFRGGGEAQQTGPQPGERRLTDPPAVTIYTTGGELVASLPSVTCNRKA